MLKQQKQNRQGHSTNREEKPRKFTICVGVVVGVSLWLCVCLSTISSFIIHIHIYLSLYVCSFARLLFTVYCFCILRLMRIFNFCIEQKMF